MLLRRYTTCLSQVIGTQQPLASMPNSPRFSWTHASSRESNQATYVSRYHERENYGKHSPGGCASVHMDGCCLVVLLTSDSLWFGGCWFSTSTCGMLVQKHGPGCMHPLRLGGV